ncbi:MAG: chromosomal replication initiator protein DnaA [Clostridiales bacterium]|nr:chromosomal replication initiator protein DnaA [Clostridiales bacterium]
MKDINAVWQEMLTIMQVETHSLGFDVWIQPLRPIKVEGDILTLCAPSAAAKSEVAARYLPLLKRALREIEEAPSELVLVSDDEVPEPVAESVHVDRQQETAAVRPEINKLNPRYNFAEFVVGDSNKLAYHSAFAVAEAELGTKFNPLFIYGDVGLGKTHIMQAIGNDLRVSRPHTKMLYVSMDTFINEFIASIRGLHGINSQAFRDKYRNLDLLMIDDVQFLSGKPSTQEELFHTFEALKNAGKQMVFTSDRRPQDIPDLDDRVRSRFSSSMIVDIQPPALETRIAILQNKSQAEKKNIALEPLTYIAERVTGSVRDMEGVLTKVLFLSSLYDRKVDLEMCKEALKDYLAQESEDISVDEIIDCTCKYYDVQKSDVVGKRKNKDVVIPRQIAIYLINEMTNIPLSSIGKYFGGKEHTTIMYSRDKVASLMNTDSKIKTAVGDIKAMVLRK